MSYCNLKKINFYTSKQIAIKMKGYIIPNYFTFETSAIKYFQLEDRQLVK